METIQLQQILVEEHLNLPLPHKVNIFHLQIRI